MPVQDTLPLSLLKELLDYCPETGVFTWRVTTNTRASAGSEAGYVKEGLYRTIRIFCANHYAHRLAWYYMTGAWPEKNIDHINGDGLDNRFSNLRLATQAENRQNVRKGSGKTSKYLGVSWDKTQRKWLATIVLCRKQKILGRFSTEEDAHAAYLAAKKELHTFNPVPRPCSTVAS